MRGSFLSYMKLRFYKIKKRSAVDAHSHDVENVANATVLGARMR